MPDSVRPPNSPAWTDLILLAMGLALIGGVTVGVFSATPLRVGGSVGSLLAVATLIVGMLWRPSGDA